MAMPIRKKSRLDSLFSEEFIFFPLIFILAATFRLIDLPTRWLWYDELQSVTQSILPVKQLLTSVGISDPHPPLYYLQLHFWMLFGTTDEWIKLNSVGWSLLTLIVLFFVSKRLFNFKVAYLAALLFAISPFAISYAQEARMYAMLMFCAVGSFYFYQRFVEQPKWFYMLGAMMLSLGMLYGQGAGFMILVSVGAYAVMILVESGFRKLKVFVLLCLSLLITSALYIPWLFRAYTITVGQAMIPTWVNVADTLYVLLGGYSKFPTWVQWSMVLLCSVGMAIWSIRSKPLRTIAIPYIFVPVIFSILVSIYYRPIWLYRTIAYTLPFWCVGIAFILHHTASALQHLAGGKVWRYGLITIAVSLLVYATLVQQYHFSYSWRIEDAARFIRHVARPGDVVYIASPRVFWGMSWYLAGPGSVNPLTTTYVLDSPSGVRLYSSPARTAELEATTDWIVYRSLDDIEPFAVDPSNQAVWDFHNMQVAFQGR